MDYEKLVSCQKGRASIISVEKYSDVSYGKLCVSRMKECMQIRMNIMHSIPSGNTDNNVMR